MVRSRPFTSLITTVFLFSLFHIINLSNIIILIFILLILLYSFYAIAHYIKDIQNKDPKGVVIDEVIGQSIPIYLYEVTLRTNKSFQEAAATLLINFYFF